MAEYNNAAGRILAVFERLVKTNRSHVKLPDLANGFQVNPEWESIFTAYCDLKNEYDTLIQEIEAITDSLPKKKLYRQNLPDIGSSLKSFVFTVTDDMASYNISREGLVALQFIAADLPQEPDASVDDLNTIRQIVTDLQNEIEKSTIFTKQTREWLLDLVRIIRDSIDRYANRGSKGMKKQISLLIGELMQNYNLMIETEKKAPSIWIKFITTIDLMNKIASLGEIYGTAISFGKRLLPLARTLDLPNPHDLDQ